MRKLKYPNRVRKYRRLKDLTQQELADLTDRRRETISQIENGHERPGSELMYKLAEVLECGLDDLFLPRVFNDSKQGEAGKEITEALG